MSSHRIYIQCSTCQKVESLYTGSITTDEFDDSDWEGEFITVPVCIECKARERKFDLSELGEQTA